VDNGYAGDIPANSVVIVSSATRRVVTVSRPTAKDATAVLVTGFQVTKQSKGGHASAAWPLWVKYNGTLAAGGALGTAVNSFEMTGGNAGFTALAVDSTNHLALIIPASGSLPAGTSGDLLYHNGTSWVVLNKAGNGDVLRLAAGVPSWWTPAIGHIWHPCDMAETSGSLSCDGADHDLDLTSKVGTTAVAVSLSLFHSASYWQLKRKDDTNMATFGAGGVYSGAVVGCKAGVVTYNLSSSGYALYRVVGWWDIT
jgi:hypothetical protein